MTYKDAAHLSSRTVTNGRMQRTLYSNDIIIKMQRIFQVEQSLLLGCSAPYTAMTYKDAVHPSSRTATIARVQRTLYNNDI